MGKKLVQFLFIITLTSGLISQLPILYQTQSAYILRSMWFVLFLFLLLFKSSSFFSSNLRIYYLFSILFSLYALSLHVLREPEYIDADVRNVLISLLVLTSSYVFWKHYGDYSILRVIAILSLFSGLFLAFDTSQTAFVDYDVLADSQYVFGSKNSMGMILLCIALLSFLILQPKNLIIKLLLYCSLLYIIYIIFLMKSRAVIVSFVFLILYFIMQSERKSTRIALLVITIGSLLIIINNQQIYNSLVNGILLNNQSLGDINSVSSNRIVLLRAAIRLIPDNFIFGIGSYYVDLMPVSMLLQFGIFGAIIIFLYLFFVTSRVIASRNTYLGHIAFLLFIVIMINTLFEAQPPFGPGMKCFLLWMFIGFSLAENEEEHLYGLVSY